MRRISIGTLLTLLLAACGVNDQLSVVAPQLLDMHPLPGATDVATDTDVWARFDADVDEAWLTGSFTLTSQGGSVVTVAVSYDAATRKATFTPSAALEFGTAYEAALGGGLDSQAIGGALAEDVSWSFSTAAAPTGDGDGEGTGGDGNGDGDGTGDGDGDGDGTGDGDGDGTGGGDGDGDGTGDGDGEGDGDGDGGEAGGTGNSGEGTEVADCTDDHVCTYENHTFNDDVIVPPYAHWTLTNVTINGYFEVGEGAVVIANNVLFGGKFEATNADQIVVHNSTVLDWMELKYGSLVDLYMTEIGLHLQIIGHDGNGSAIANEVHGSYMSVEANSGGVTVTGNSGPGTLSCSGNLPVADASDNVFDGGMSGECSAD